MALREINSDAHADARVTTGRAAGPNRVRIFALWTGHGETAVPIVLEQCTVAVSRTQKRLRSRIAVRRWNMSHVDEN